MPLLRRRLAAFGKVELSPPELISLRAKQGTASSASICEQAFLRRPYESAQESFGHNTNRGSAGIALAKRKVRTCCNWKPSKMYCLWSVTGEA